MQSSLPTPRKAFGALRASLCLTALTLATPLMTYAVDGYAATNGGTKGGSGGTSVTVKTLADFTKAVGDDTARVVHVSGTINLGSSSVRVGSNKTIIGVGAHSGFVGDIKTVSENNIIFQNLNFTNPKGVGDGDGLTLQKTKHVSVEHCTFVDCADGSLDITHACDWITVEWCKFHYTRDAGHNFVNLIGHSDSNASEDTGKLHVTMHHNWYSTLCKERMPRVRFGRVHVYNNYYGAAGSNYNVGIGDECQVLVETCYFDGQAMPWKNYSDSSHQGLIHWNSGNVFVNTKVPTWAKNSTVFNPAYNYTLSSGSNVKSSVTNASSGAGTH